MISDNINIQPFAEKPLGPKDEITAEWLATT